MKLSESELRGKIKEVIAEKAGIEIKDLSSDDHLIDDLGVDSLGIVEMAMRLEEVLHLEDGAVDNDKLYDSGVEFTVQAIEDFIVKLLLG